MKRAINNPLTVIAILLGLTSALAQGASQNQPVQKEERAALFPSVKMINMGQDVAETTCASCHGMDGISDSEGKPYLAGQRAVYLYRTLQAYQAGTRDDETRNHGGFLTEQAMLSVSAYYASLAPVQIVASTDAAEATEQVAVADEDPFLSIRDSMRKCIKCHDESGNSSRSGLANLTAQDPEYFVTSMLAYVDGSRNHKLMKKLVSKLDEVTIRKMGVFYGVQEPLQSETRGEGDANVGRRLSEDCKNCHGGDGNAQKAKMPTLAGQDAKYFIKAMTHYKDGKRQHEKMFEAVELLSEQDMIDLATYYAMQEPVKRNVRAPLKSTEWIKRCERCHGIGGNSSDPRFPMLAGQDEVYLKKVLHANASEERNKSTMHKMTDQLSAMDVELIALHFTSQQPKAVIYIQAPCEDDDSTTKFWFW
jgi:cytochrome c553